MKPMIKLFFKLYLKVRSLELCFCVKATCENSLISTAFGITDFNVIGEKPSISDDGKFIAFMGSENTLGTGIFGIRSDINPRELYKIAGETGLSSVGKNTRIGVNGASGKYTITFLATSTSGVLGLYVNQVELSNDSPPKVKEPILILEVGDKIDDLPGAIQEFGLYDPVNSYGNIAFWVVTDSGTQAIVRGAA